VTTAKSNQKTTLLSVYNATGDNLSLQEQKEKLFEYAQRQGTKENKSYTENNTGECFKDRPALSELMSDIKKRKVGMIVTQNRAALGNPVVVITDCGIEIEETDYKASKEV